MGADHGTRWRPRAPALIFRDHSRRLLNRYRRATLARTRCRLTTPRLRIVQALLLPVLFHPAGGAAQEAPFPVPRLTGPIEIDGRVDEAAWLAIPPLEALSSSPVFGVPPSERTEFRLAYDDEFLYLSGRLYDSEPEGIRATSLRRDDGAMSNDWLVINLDTFMDRQTALVFGVTPAGVLTDAIFPNDAETGPNFAWNTFWEARATIDGEGWSAEIRVPLSSLRFEVEDGRVVMGVTIWRNIARKNEIVSWPAIEHRWGFISILKASQTRPVALEGVDRSNPVYVTPYLLSGPSRVNRLEGGESAYRAHDDWTRDTGLDLKVSPTSNFTLDLTLNTDFAQVEADDQQVNLTRFSLFFPERRLFFQERGELFDFGLGGSDRLFYTRRIGLVDGRPTRIYGGARVTGRIGGWDLGFLDMQTAASGDTGSENAGLLRVRREVLNGSSYVGGIVTSRIEAQGGRSFAGGGDALLNPRGQNYISLGVAATHQDGDTLEIGKRTFARARWERRGVYGLGVDVELAHVGSGFEPTLGFLARRDHARGTGSVGWGWRSPQGSSLLRQRATLGFAGYRRYADGALDSGELRPQWFVETLTGHSVTLSGTVRHEDLTRSFSIAPQLSVPEGVHRFGSGRIAYTPGQSAVLRLSGNAEAGTFFDGRIVSASVTPTWNASRHLELTGGYQVNRISFPARDQKRVTHVARLRTLVMLNTQLSGVALLQVNSASDAMLVNLRIRYNPREGNDLYLVYNHGVNVGRFDHDPVRPFTDNRTLLMKYSHTLTLRR